MNLIKMSVTFSVLWKPTEYPEPFCKGISIASKQSF